MQNDNTKSAQELRRYPRYGVGARWRCRWYATNDDGTKTQKSKTFTRLSDAEEFRTAMEDDIRRGRYVDPADAARPFSAVADEWAKSKVANRDSTNNRYSRELRIYAKPKWGDRGIGSITAKDMADWVSELMKGTAPSDMKRGKPGPLSSRSIRNVVKVVTGGVLQYAVDHKYITDNVARNVEIPEIVESEHDKAYLTVAEVEALAASAEKLGSHVDYVLVEFLAFTGVRINEALALQVRDMSIDDHRARVRRTWTEDPDRGMKLGPPKNGKSRTIAVPGFLDGDIHNLCDGQPDTAFVFRAPRGGHIHDHNWRSRIWSHAVRNAGLEDIKGLRIHSLRHTYASFAIAARADVKTLQAQLGHASAVETLNTYAALWPERLGEVADAVDKARSAAIVSNSVQKGSQGEGQTASDTNGSKG